MSDRPDDRPRRLGTERGVVPLGHVRGVPVGAHWSVLGIVVLVALVLARGEFSVLAPGHAAGAYAVAGLAGALLLVLSLLAHETAHALVCRAHGLRVDGITLWLLGGVTRLRDDPDRAGTELRVAIVGPVTSVAVAGVLGLASLALRPVAGTLVLAVLVELAVVNLALAVFNLLPAAPLDGGRVLRALLWARSGDRWRAQQGAARAGVALGVLLATLGLLVALAAGPGGLWLVILGWFIGTAAGDEGRRARLARALRGAPVADALGPRPLVLPETITADDLVDALRHVPPGAAEGGVLLVRHGDGEPAAFLPPDRAAALLSASRPDRALPRLVVPTTRLRTAAADAALSPLLGGLAEPDGRLVVLDHGEVVATVSALDVLRLADTLDPAPAGRRGSTPAATPPPPPDWWWHGGPGGPTAASR